MTERPSPPDHLTKAISLIRAGKSREALPILDDLIEGDPGSFHALRERGLAKKFTNDLPGALADFSEVIRRWPDNPVGFTSRADARRLAEDWDGAIDDYSSAIAIDPNHKFAYLQRGRLKVRTGNMHGAIADFTQDTKHSKTRLSGLLNRGTTKHLIGDLEGALDDLSEAIRLEGVRPVFAPLFRGRVKLTAGDFPGAIVDFTAAIEAFPRLTNALRLRAEARGFAGDASGANEDRQRYEELGGEDLPAFT
ncbi:MAG: tetratricopeptide repeat protein [Planctomycetes bacterium]|nr:tetratricopeptide repeat protein [Planctomycetota bacterium]